MDILLFVLNLGGTFVFAISGAMMGVRHRLDFFGVMVLAFVAGNAGSITRDVLIGIFPPAALAHWWYVGISVLAGVVTYARAHWVNRLSHPVMWFDAAGLGFFAVAGTQTALLHGLPPVMSALLGMVTGIGGGMLRDLLVIKTPIVLRADFYALAALAGAVVVVIGHLLRIPPAFSTSVGAVICFVLRVMAFRYGWHLPAARPPAE